MLIKAADDKGGDVLALERLLARPDVATAMRKHIQTQVRNIRGRGGRAEHDAAYQIELYFGRSENWATIDDLRIEIDGSSAQIDHRINRLAEVWVCESKAFAEGVSVNEYGEWSRWWHRRHKGMPSPIEQNQRHIHLLERVSTRPRPLRRSGWDSRR